MHRCLARFYYATKTFVTYYIVILEISVVEVEIL